MKSALSYPFATVPPAGTVQQIQPGVLWLRMPLPMKLDHINLYLLEDAEGWWIVDTGIRSPETREHWESIFANALGGKPVVGIVCTHCHPDHIGQAGWLSERWRAPLWMTQSEYYHARVFSSNMAEGSMWEALDFYTRAGASTEFIENFPKRARGYGALVEPLPRSYHRVVEGDVLSIGGSDWEAVVGQGHSPEHLCLLNRTRRLLLSGDQVIPIITSNVSVMGVEPEANPLQDWIDSLQRFMQLPDDVLVLPAHNTPFHGLHARLRALMAHHEHHLLALEEACIEPRTVRELLPVIFRRPLDVEQTSMAMGECIAHLNLLRRRGVLRREVGADNLYRYALADPALRRRDAQADDGRDDGLLMEYDAGPV